MMYLFCMYRRCVKCCVRISVVALSVVVREGVCCCIVKVLNVFRDFIVLYSECCC